MIADLLQAREDGEDQAAAADAGGGVDLPEHLGRRPLVHRRLLDREIAVDLHFDLGGQIAGDFRIGLGAAEDKRTDHPAELLAAILVEQFFDRDGESLAEIAGEPSKPGLSTSMIDQSSERWFSIGVPVRATRRGEISERIAMLEAAEGFLIFCASSSAMRCHRICARSSRSRWASA